MRIKRLLVRNFRGIDEQEVRFASEGVTVLVGPNETGKSSLAEAFDLLIEFPDSSGHSRVRAVKPVHRDEGAEVEADIEVGEYAFTYGKRFHRRSRTYLNIQRPAPENLTGREAHERALGILAEVADLDLWRALRIQQGAELDLPHLAGRSSLAAALDRAAGESRAGEAEESLFDAIRAEFERYFTAARGELKTEHRTVRDTVARARADLEAAERELAELETAVTRCADLSRRSLDLRDRLVELEENARRRKAEWEEVRDRVAELERLTERSAAAAERKKEADRRLADRKQLAERVRARAEDLETQRAELDSRRAELESAQELQAAAAAALREAEKLAGDAAREFDLRDKDLEHLNGELELARLSERRDRIEEAVNAAAKAEAFLDTCRIDDEALAEISRAQTDVVAARARTEAQSASLRITALSDLSVRIDGETRDLRAGEVEERHVTDDLDVEVPDAIRITARAGGGTGDLKRAQDSAEGRLDKLLAEAGATDLEEAARINEERKEAVRRVDDRDRIVEENLRDLSRERLEQKLRNLQARVSAYPKEREAELPIPGTFDEAQDLKRRAEKKRDLQTSLLTDALEALRTREDALRSLVERRGEEESGIHEMVGRLRRDEEALDVDRGERPDAALEADAGEAGARLATAREELGAIRKALAERNPDAVRVLAENAEATLGQAEAEEVRVSRELTEVETELRLKGKEGLGERVEEARSALFRAEREWESLDRRARAARTLFETFREKREEARRAYVAPLAGKIRSLGAIVFGPDFEVTLGDDLAVESRTMGGRTVPFADLSGGAKEQVSLLARLACAMTVAEDGGVPLILDDALGYTDPGRLESMGAVLSLAGRSCQVIVMTCVPERYRHVGEKEVVPFD